MNWFKNNWEFILFPLSIFVCMLIFIISLSIQAQEYQVSMDALTNYNDHDLMQVVNVHYTEVYREFERGFPDFWNIKTVNSFVTAEYLDGSMKSYMIVTNIETGEYILQED